MTERKALYAECSACRHVWPVVYLPMELRKAAQAASRATCPGCGETKKIRVASAEAVRRHEEQKR